VRLAPPLIINAEQVDLAVELFATACRRVLEAG